MGKTKTKCHACKEDLILEESLKCKKCSMSYHRECGEKSGVLSNGAIRKCCDIEYWAEQVRDTVFSQLEDKMLETTAYKNLDQRIKKFENEELFSEINNREKRKYNCIAFNIKDNNNSKQDKKFIIEQIKQHEEFEINYNQFSSDESSSGEERTADENEKPKNVTSKNKTIIVNRDKTIREQNYYRA